MKNSLISILTIVLLCSTASTAFFAGAAFSGSRALKYIGDPESMTNDVPGLRFSIGDDVDIDSSIAILFGIASGFVAVTICGVFIVGRQKKPEPVDGQTRSSA